MEIYLVGGAVRDELLGLPIHERDYVVVGGTPQDLLAQGFTQVGKDFPVFLHPQTQEEYALARTERKSGKGYTGFDCYAAPDVTLADDLKRRDLTVNAIAKDANGQLIDPYGGLADINARVLRHVSPAFAEDPLRVLRCARFLARFTPLGFRLADETEALMRKMIAAKELLHLVSERVWQELQRSLSGPCPDVFCETLDKLGAWPQLLTDQPDNERLSQWQTVNWQPLRTLRNKIDEQAATQPSFPLAVAYTLFAQQVQRANPSYTDHALASALRVPNECAQLNEVTSYCCQRLSPASLAAEPLAAVIQRADPLRRPERWQNLLLVLELLQWGNQQAREAFAASGDAYCGVNPQELITQGFQGPELGQQLQQRRLDAVRRALAEQCA